MGDNFTLPDDVRHLARCHHANGTSPAVIAWTTVDPARLPIVGPFQCVDLCANFTFYPCFWPHLLILWPFFIPLGFKAKDEAYNTYWILTETELKIVTKSCNSLCCVNGIFAKRGNVVKTIPLSSVRYCKYEYKASKCSCCVGAQLLHVELGTENVTCGEAATGIELSGHEGFVKAVLHQRNLVQSRLRSTAHSAWTASAAMERGDATGSSYIFNGGDDEPSNCYRIRYRG